VERAVNVVHGLPSKHKWAPRIAEIKEFLEDLMAPIRREEDRQEIERQYRRSLPPPIDRSNRPTYEELKARCAADGLMIGKQTSADNPVKAAADFRAQNGISLEEWNAIPNAPRRAE
jgi:hypothetical protein